MYFSLYFIQTFFVAHRKENENNEFSFPSTIHLLIISI